MLSIIVFAPLIASIVAGFSYKCNDKRFSEAITILGMIISFLLSFKLFYEFHGESLRQELFNWIQYSNLKIEWCLFADRLTLVMLLIITSVSLLVHIYSIGYMKDDATIPRFMSYLSLFTFSMLMLVTSDNLLQLFFGWEGVGVCSYLLIGYWYQKESANNASIKAFMMNRIGDIAFILGAITIYAQFNSLRFEDIFSSLGTYNGGKINIVNYEIEVLDLICILLFVGSMGKSAQIGLHTWLADAMEGPTPVSALIHAATMVTAGVFLIVRCSWLYEHSEIASNLIVIVGSITCLFGAFTAITQNDIKKIIAYSTCSQLGYMFIACGIHAYNAAIFHLLTHAFFKSLLFLGAGSVINALHHEQDIRKMGNLVHRLPLTHLLMMIGSVAIVGLYPLSGYYSKEAILGSAYVANNPYGKFAFIMGVTAVFGTAFYSWRLLIKVFYNQGNYTHEVAEHIHESPKIMMLPMSILACAAIFVGYLFDNYYGILGEDFWAKSIVIHPELEKETHSLSLSIKFLPPILTLSAIVLAYMIYGLREQIAEFFARKFSFIYRLSLNKLYFDEIYNKVVVRSFVGISKFGANIIDTKLIDSGMVNNFGSYFNILSKLMSKLQSGYVYHYVLVMMFSMIAILTYIIFK